jgi:Fungal specific transcription factor domain
VESLLQRPGTSGLQLSGYDSTSTDLDCSFIGPASGLSVLWTDILAFVSVSRSMSTIDGCIFQEELELCQESLSKVQQSVQKFSQIAELVSEPWYPLPTEIVTSTYVDTYFNTCQHMFPVVRRESFESALKESQGRRPTENVSCYVLHNAILAMGAFTSQLASVSASDRCAKIEATKYFCNALRMQSHMFQSPANLMTIQALVVLSMFSQTRGHHGLAYRFSSLACILAKSKGLHMMTREQVDRDVVKGYDCCRVFWIVYIFDKIQAVHAGYSANIDDASISCPFPPPQESDSSDFPDDSMSVFLQWARYAHILSDIQTQLYSTTAINTETKRLLGVRDQLCSRLKSWDDDLPAVYQAQNISLRTSTLAPRLKPIRALLLRIGYYSALATIHKRFSSFMISRFLTKEDISDIQHSDREFLQAAREKILLLDHVDIGVDAPHWVLAYMLLSATIPIFVNIIANPLESSVRDDIALMHIATGMFAKWEFTTSGDISFDGVVELSRLVTAIVDKAKEQQRSTVSRSLDNFGLDAAYDFSFDPFTPIGPLDSVADSSETTHLAESSYGSDFQWRQSQI